jgi:hypothetical protein
MNQIVNKLSVLYSDRLTVKLNVISYLVTFDYMKAAFNRL